MDHNTKLEEIEAMLRECGVDPDDFDILHDAPIVLTSLINPEHGMACCAAINKKTGLIMLLAFKMQLVEASALESKSLIIQ